MNIENLRLARNILLRSALISYVILLLSALIWYHFAGTWMGVSTTWYQVTPEKVNNLLIDFLSVAKFFAIFFLLVPGLAIHWTLKSEMSRNKKASVPLSGSASLSGAGG